MTKTTDALQTLWNAIPEDARGEAEDDAHVELREFIANMLDEQPTVDTVGLRALLDNAEWAPRPDYGEGVTVAYHGVGGQLADALGWECSSCRSDVGWADWTRAEKDAAGEITLYVECGHCGSDYAYDSEGSRLD